MPPIAKILPLVTARGLPGELDYLEPSLAPVGTVVQIPLGGRTVEGVITGRSERTEFEEAKLKAVEGVSDRSVPAELVRLAQWLADDVASTTARALSLVTPPRGNRKQRLWVSLTGGGGAGDLKVTATQRELLDSLAQTGARPAGDQLPRWRTLEKRGLVKIEATDELRRPPQHAVGAGSADAPALTDEQQAALKRIERASAAGASVADTRLLLHGVTGSGKTEVYLQAAAATLAQGKTALVLVPEIGLTPQIVYRFRERFGDTVALLHSALKPGERRDEWWRARSGEATIVVGARSAVFAPLENIGLVIVDEEHDASYKHESDPRYDARRVAAWRAAENGAVLLCGSATPRAESFAGLETIRMANRVDGRGMPPVEIVDMNGASGPLHATTREALSDASKAIVLLNRRGWSNFLECRECGHAFGCPNCDVTLVLHQRRGSLECHHCGHTERRPTGCPACGSVSLAQHGVGTERLEQELLALGLNVLRIDADVAEPAAVLAEFGRAERAVLVGTQLVAKGHDFPDVDLAVVLDADSTLRFPDMRAEERTFALVTQLAGRAGRGGDGHGRVLVQTKAPQNPVILAAAAHDTEGFLAAELARRQAFGYPPYSTLIRLIVSHHDQGTARDLARALAAPLGRSGVGELLGPSTLFRVRGKEREQLLLKTTHRRPAVAAVRAAVATIEREASRLRAQLSIDVAPQ